MIRKTTLFTLTLFFPFVLLAHGSHGGGIMAGITHPIFGLDHAIAIMGVGLLGALIDKSKWYLYLISFLIPMIIGGYFGINEEATFLIEKIIAFSVFAIGLFMLYFKKINTNLIFIVLAIFGFFHGFAHGAEMPDTTTGPLYITGFAIGTLIMGTIGMLICKFLNPNDGTNRFVNFVAGFVVGCGALIILG